MGFLKISLLTVPLIYLKGPSCSKRALLLSLLILDLSQAALFGIGRFNQDIESAVAFRYQFPILLSFTLSLAWTAERFIQQIGGEKFRRPVLQSIFLIGVLWWVAAPWGVHLNAHTKWQGSQAKRVLRDEPTKAELRLRDKDWNGVPLTMTLIDAQDVIARTETHR